MLVVGFATGALQANCYLLAADAGRACVIVDPGEAAMAALDEQIQTHRLEPAVVVCTHGHVDHVDSVGEVCAKYGIRALLHRDDHAMFCDPRSWASAATQARLAALLRPRDGAVLDELGSTVSIDGMTLAVLPTPGHTAGSVTLRCDTAEGATVLLTGDTLFAGSVGRTDLPGGDERALRHSLAALVADAPLDAVLLPGHGPSSTMRQQRATNPFLTGEDTIGVDG